MYRVRVQLREPIEGKLVWDHPPDPNGSWDERQAISYMDFLHRAGEVAWMYKIVSGKVCGCTLPYDHSGNPVPNQMPDSD